MESLNFLLLYHLLLNRKNEIHCVPTTFVGTVQFQQGLWEQTTWFLIGCSYKFMGTIVPTKIGETPNGGFLLTDPTKVSEQTDIYN